MAWRAAAETASTRPAARTRRRGGFTHALHVIVPARPNSANAPRLVSGDVTRTGPSSALATSLIHAARPPPHHSTPTATISPQLAPSTPPCSPSVSSRAPAPSWASPVPPCAVACTALRRRSSLPEPKTTSSTASAPASPSTPPRAVVSSEPLSCAAVAVPWALADALPEFWLKLSI
jgi:hypothetical protein